MLRDVAKSYAQYYFQIAKDVENDIKQRPMCAVVYWKSKGYRSEEFVFKILSDYETRNKKSTYHLIKSDIDECLNFTNFIIFDENLNDVTVEWGKERRNDD